MTISEPQQRCFQNAKELKFSGTSPLDPTGEGLQHSPRLPSCTSFSPCYAHRKTDTPQYCWIQHYQKTKLDSENDEK